MNNDNTEIIMAPTNAIEHQPRRRINPMEVIQERNAMLEQILSYAISSTHPGQWVDIGGKPYPTGPACEAMARRCAVRMEILSREKIPSSDDMGDFYMYVYRCRFMLPGGLDSIDAEGTCSSRDEFLGTETRAGRPLSQIDEGNIMKAALTNARNNGITQLLGLRNVAWERLQALGVDRDGMSKVNYDTGGRGGGRGSVANEPIKFGPAQGKRFDEMTDKHLQHYLQAFKRDLADPEKEKFHANTVKRLSALEAEIAARAAAQATEPKPTEAAPVDEATQKRLVSIVELLDSAGIANHGQMLTFVRDVAKSNKLPEPTALNPKQSRFDQIAGLTVDLQNALHAQLKLMVK